MIGFGPGAFGQPASGAALILEPIALVVSSVSVNVDVPEVMNTSLGSDDLSNKGIASVVSTCVPETLVSQEALKASRIVMVLLAMELSKPAPPLLISVSMRPWVLVISDMAAEREGSEERSVWMQLRVLGECGIEFSTVVMADEPLLGSRQPMMME